MRNYKKPLLAVSMLASMGATAAERPNLLFIVTDEHNFRTLGCYREQLPQDQAEVWGEGNVVETPNLDLIASRGVLFNKMYTSTSVSTPARAAMFTGYYGIQLGIPNNSNKPGDGKYLKEDVKTIAQCFVEAGYHTGYAGKWHIAEERGAKHDEWWQPYPVGCEGNNYGFEDNKFMFNGGHGKYLGMDENGNPYFGSKQIKKVRDDEYGQPVYKDAKGNNVKYTTDFLVDRTLDFLDENSGNDKPFYYVLSIPDPHTPDYVREPYDTMFTSMDFVRPRTYNAPRPEGTPSWQKPDGKATVVTTAVAQYFGMVKNIDDNIGRILDKLESDGILENTIIVFTSDHGDLMGEHARMNKGTIHEASLKVPFLISYGTKGKNKSIPKGVVNNHVANTTDWMPTFLSLCGVDAPKTPGRDLTPIMGKRPQKDWKDITFSQLGYICAVDSRYKLLVSPWEDGWLVDLEKDPDEVINFVNDPKYKDVVVRLAKELTDYNSKINKGAKNYQDKLDKLINR